MFAIFSKARKCPTHTKLSAARANAAHACATRTALENALLRRDHERARVLLVELQTCEPSEPRWPHKLGELLRHGGNQLDAALACRKAAELYAARGFVERAQAMAHLADMLGGNRAALRSLHPSVLNDAASAPAILEFVQRD